MAKFILGTAMWGWTMNPEQCFDILDVYYANGGREIDTATNYPINKNPKDFRLAENILLDWINTNNVTDLEVMMKIGSINNLATPDHNLSPSFLLMTGRQYQYKFKSNLATLMIHWDNRSDDNEISASLDILQDFKKDGLKIGFSGLKHPEPYAKVLNQYPDFSNLRIQIKHNLLYSDYQRYQSFHSKARFIAYGINGGGLKLDDSKYQTQASLLARGGQLSQHESLVTVLNKLISTIKNGEQPVPSRMNHLGLLNAYHHPAIDQILLGVSSKEQLLDSLSWIEILESHDYSMLYQSLLKLL